MRPIRSLFLVALCTAAPSGVFADALIWRSTVTLPPDPTTIDALDAFAIAEQLGDSLAVELALRREDWPGHLREWSAARWAARQGRAAEALLSFEHAAATWPSDTDEPALVLALFDQQRLELALALDDLERADAIVRTPLRPHHDAIWRALRARVELRRGQRAEAADRIARAWAQAEPVERRHSVFLHAPDAYLAVGDTAQAVLAWQQFVAEIRRPERLRDAVEVWEASSALRQAVGDSEDPGPTLGFLTRALRRAEAADLVRARIAAGLGDPVEQQLFVAEQLYRLREHAALSQWLEQTDRSGWEAEAQARAEAYRWGVARRAGASLEVARGFDAVADRWPDTPRAAEALWEAAWMYELADATAEARDRYARHVLATGPDSFRSAAALRTILLPWREADFAAAATAFARHEAALGDGMDQAAAFWLMSRIPDAEPGYAERLRGEHPASPFWRGLGPDPGAAAVPGPAALSRLQQQAFARVARELGLEDPLQELPESLSAIARLARIGLRTEATIWLDAWARERSQDDRARLQMVAVAWAHGLAEMQARHAWFLERRLGGGDPELDAALRSLALPTPYAGVVQQVAAERELPAALIWALVRRESFFDADVVSLAGACGLMQLLPATAEAVASRSAMSAPTLSDLFVPAVNLRLGSAYLAGLLDEAGGNWIRALASYNAGESNGALWESRLRPGEDAALGILLISYSETRSYVYNVLRAAHLYEDAWKAGS